MNSLIIVRANSNNDIVLDSCSECTIVD